MSDTSIFQIKKLLAERDFDPRTSGLWAQHASTAPLCLLLMVNQHLHNTPSEAHPEGLFCVLAGIYTIKVVVAEWLRRWTRNPLGSPRAGSNPADYVNDDCCFFQSQRTYFYTRAITIDPTGL